MKILYPFVMESLIVDITATVEVIERGRGKITTIGTAHTGRVNSEYKTYIYDAVILSTSC